MYKSKSNFIWNVCELYQIISKKTDTIIMPFKIDENLNCLLRLKSFDQSSI